MIRRLVRPMGVMSLAVIVATGCPKSSTSGNGGGGSGGVPSAEDWTDQHTLQVEQACGRCHEAPRPKDLPRSRWAKAVQSMAGLQGTGKTATADELGLAEAYYTREAPEALSFNPQSKTLSEKVAFEKESFTPPDKKLLELKIPAVANVRFAFLSDGKRRDLLVSDMRTSSLLLHMPWRQGKGRNMRRLGKDLNYPVRANLRDVNKDGRTDIMVAGHGQMQPGNETKGSAILMLQANDRKFLNYEVAKGLGRPADLQAADLDGDKDIDLLVAAFGWRGPGKLVLLENKSPGGTIQPKFTERELDPRDGWIHVGVTDLDGDGRLDVVGIVAQEHEQIVAFMNKGGLKFEPTVLFRAMTPTWGFSGMELVDLDGDGDKDVLASNGDTLDDDLLKPYHGVVWFENKGKLTFKNHAIGSLYGCEATVAADVDGDGDMDVVASSFLPQLEPTVWEDKRLDSVVWFEQTGKNRWERHSLEKGKNYHPTVDAADYNADGKVDIVVGNYVWLKGEAGAAGKPSFQADYITLFTQK